MCKDETKCCMFVNRDVKNKTRKRKLKDYKVKKIDVLNVQRCKIHVERYTNYHVIFEIHYYNYFYIK